MSEWFKERAWATTKEGVYLALDGIKNWAFGKRGEKLGEMSEWFKERAWATTKEGVYLALDGIKKLGVW